MWPLIIVVCVANGVDAQCEEWKVRPFDKRADCFAARTEKRAELQAAKPLHLALTCEKGLFG